MSKPRKLDAFYFVNDIKIVPASSARPSYVETTANSGRCLPFTIANSAGWFLLNPYAFNVVWDGGSGVQSMYVDYTELIHLSGGKSPTFPAKSHFGGGILTIDIPIVWQTPQSWSLLIRGPANMPKDGIAPLEGIIETDWTAMPFPMNWQMTRAGSVHFAKNEPFAMLVPMHRGDLQSFVPKIAPITEELKSRFEEYYSGRQYDWAPSDRPNALTGYPKGDRPDGSKGPSNHERKIVLRKFDEG